LLSIALGLKGQTPVALNPTLMFLFVKVWFMAWSTHLAKVILFGSMWLFLDITASLTFLNVLLTGLKQNTSNGCRACDVWDGKVIIFNSNFGACYIAFRVTWLPCPSKTNKCQLVRNIPFGIDFLKKANNSLNKNEVIQTLFCIAVQVLGLQSLM
jgi:hypothetical protein